MNFKVIQQFQRVTGIFTGDLVDFFEDAQRAQGNVFQIADGSGD